MNRVLSKSKVARKRSDEKSDQKGGSFLSRSLDRFGGGQPVSKQVALCKLRDGGRRLRSWLTTSSLHIGITLNCRPVCCCCRLSAQLKTRLRIFSIFFCSLAFIFQIDSLDFFLVLRLVTTTTTFRCFISHLVLLSGANSIGAREEKIREMIGSSSPPPLELVLVQLNSDYPLLTADC